MPRLETSVLERYTENSTPPTVGYSNLGAAYHFLLLVVASISACNQFLTEAYFVLAVLSIPSLAFSTSGEGFTEVRLNGLIL